VPQGIGHRRGARFCARIGALFCVQVPMTAGGRIPDCELDRLHTAIRVICNDKAG
jgi:hypothetical protein